MSTNTTINLPEAIDRYFEASNRFDATTAAACFTPDAVVHDEGHVHKGTDAILGWISESSEKYQPHATVIKAGEEGSMMSVLARVAGNFPGSPVELTFNFQMRDNKIADLGVQ